MNDLVYICDDCLEAVATDTYNDYAGALYYVCESCYNDYLNDED
jgi:hypothetical protein